MAEKIFVPPIKLQGIKTKLVPLIRQNIPPLKNTLWLELFMGSGVAGFNIRHSRAVFADINPHIITSDIVKGFLYDYGRKLEADGGKFYYAVRESFNKSHDPLNRDHQFNVPYGHKPGRFTRAYITKIANQVRYIESCLMVYDWKFICQPFEAAIAMSDAGSFIFGL